MEVVWPRDLRAKSIADIGCGGGSLLDYLSGVSARQVAIEPYSEYRDHLARRGYATFPYAKAARAEWEGRIDLAFSIQVIEHTANPRAFLEEIRPLLAPGGELIISTPNRRDLLMELLPDAYPSFFYRVVHRWYFDVNSLGLCAELAGYTVRKTQFLQRYGMSNMLAWLRDRRPSGAVVLPGIDDSADTFWRSRLETSGRAECMFMTLEVPM